MSEVCKTVMVMADNDMGCMAINESDFDAKVHTLVDAPSDDVVMTKADLHDALTAKGIEFKNSMTKAELQALFDAA